MAVISTSVTGPFVLSATNNPLTITGTGTVTSTGAGVDAIDGASGTTWNIVNNGTISASTGNGVSLSGAGTISSSGVITGKDGVVLRAGGSVSNSGSISGTGAMGAGSSSGAAVFVTGARGTVTNSGWINGQAYGVELDAGGMVTNTGAIFGGHNAIRVFGATGTVVNSGSIFATASDVIALNLGGSVSNAAGASIASQGTAGAAVYIAGGAGTVDNSGSIIGIDYGVDLALGGTVVNNAGANITARRAVVIGGASGVVSNSGSIAGTTSVGVRLLAGGQVTNAASGSISGPVGVAIYSAAGTVTNNGTISGTSHAVTFAGSSANRLVLGSTGVFIGDVVGSTAAGSINTLELAGGSGTMSGLSGGAGTVTANARTWSFKNFASIVVDLGAVWTLNGSNTVTTILNNGTLNIASSGSLTVTTAIDPASTGVFALAGNALLDFVGGVGSGARIVFQGPSGVLELADVINGVVRQFNGTIIGLNAGSSATVPTNAVNIQATVTNATLSGNTITVFNNATTVATLLLGSAPGAGTSVSIRADATLGGYDIFLASAISPTPTVTWSPSAEIGVEGSAIALGTITPSGSTLASVLVSGIPVGATLRDGTHSFIASSGATSVNVLGWNYSTLTIQPGNDTNFALSVQATDTSGNASPVASEAVTVNPLAPTVTPGPVSGTAGQAIALNLGIVANGRAGDSNSLSSVTIGGIPTGATLSNTNGNTLTIANGSITFSAAQLAAGVLNGLAVTPAGAGSFSLSVAVTEQDAQGDLSATATSTETLTVTGTGSSVPQYDHIVVVMEENKNYNQIIGSSLAPYINALANSGASLTNYHALVHPSQPNYFALYAGSTFGVPIPTITRSPARPLRPSCKVRARPS